MDMYTMLDQPNPYPKQRLRILGKHRRNGPTSWTRKFKEASENWVGVLLLLRAKICLRHAKIAAPLMIFVETAVQGGTRRKG